MPAKYKSASEVRAFLVFRPATQRLSLKWFLDGNAYFVCIVPFFSSTNGSGKGTKIFFCIDIKHTTAGGICARVFTRSAASVLSIFALFPRHLRTDKLEGRHTAAKMRVACFGLHWKFRIIRTAWQIIFINRAIRIF